MKIISQYTPPTAQALARLKDDLGATSQSMAELCGLAQGQQWRKYTGGSTPRVMGLHMHFYMAALLTLDEASLAKVRATMREHGADLQLADGPALP
ncbi:transcriptional regulator [Pseudomonas sp. AFG_SD02_1510_Pfu_092]|uniref:XRE family transcriptional regulator n=1 Tax=Pseudomonas sp. AFG_SD02_1510_Pfu_092 TaxID=2259497 RepID=UPI000DEF2124|nr:XRE family transcriptional regulator [Pseudomonas sp. AFG_SD02_1510_Pfu_092]RCL23009.1 transcriptional regulator [Pseudomonas sp. AFG_SD02_1510_Pfu_092]